MYVYDQARLLSKAICESQEYKTLMEAKKSIDSDPTLKKMLNDYRTKQMEVQRIQLMGQNVPDDKMKAFRQIHDLAIANNMMKRYLEAEQRFAVLMADIQKILADGLNLS